MIQCLTVAAGWDDEPDRVCNSMGAANSSIVAVTINMPNAQTITMGFKANGVWLSPRDPAECCQSECLDEVCEHHVLHHVLESIPLGEVEVNVKQVLSDQQTCEDEESKPKPRLQL